MTEHTFWDRWGWADKRTYGAERREKGIPDYEKSVSHVLVVSQLENWQVDPVDMQLLARHWYRASQMLNARRHLEVFVSASWVSHL